MSRNGIRREAGEVAPWSPAGIVERLARRGEETVLVQVERDRVVEISGALLARKVWGAARTLAECGVGAGNPVALRAVNGPEWVAIGLACGWLGAILAPIDHLTDPKGAREEAANNLKARVLVTDAPSSKEPGEVQTELSLEDLGEASREEAPPAAHLEPEAPVALMRTSGTTGPQKLFHLSLANIRANVDGMAGEGLVTRADRVLLPLPMHHAFPWIVGTMTPFHCDAVLVLPEGPAGPQIARALSAARPTVMVGVPRLYNALIEGVRGRLGTMGSSLLDACTSAQRRAGVPVGRVLLRPVRRKVSPDLRLLVSGGARLDPTIGWQLAALGWDVRCGYGLAETAAIFTGHLRESRLGTEGWPLPGGDIRIDEPDENGVGQILVKGPSVFSGYVDNPKENANAFDEDGYFRTGDLGRLDETGALIVVGRVKEMIVSSGGTKVEPSALEEKYQAAAEIAEIGVFERDGVLLGLVVPEVGAVAKRGPLASTDAVRVALSSIGKNLPTKQRLTGYRLTREPLPRTRLGKIRRFQLPVLYDRISESGDKPDISPPNKEDKRWLSESPRAEIWTILREKRKDQPLGLDSHLALDLGIDSFDWMSIAIEIEDRTGIRFEAEDVAEIGTVRELLERASATEPVRDAAARRQQRLEAARKQWLSPRSAWERTAGAVVLGAITGLVRILYRVELGGLENLPASGPALLCPNHVSDLDPVVLMAAAPKHLRPQLFWIGDAVRVFGNPVYRQFCRPLRIFPADKTLPEIGIGLAEDVLAKGKIQVWFPEGWRSPDGKLLRFQPGVGEVIRRTGAPVVPIFIEGGLKIWPRERNMPRFCGRVRVTFGEMVAAEALAPNGDLTAVTAEEVSAALRSRVSAIARSRGLEVEQRPEDGRNPHETPGEARKDQEPAGKV